MPYSVFPVNLKAGDTIPQSFTLEVGFENGSPGDDVTIAAGCKNGPPGHGSHGDAQMVSSANGSVFLVLDHTGGGGGDVITVRGTISSMSPLTLQDAFEVPNVTISST